MTEKLRDWWEPKIIVLPALAVGLVIGVFVLVLLFDIEILLAVIVQLMVGLVLAGTWTFRESPPAARRRPPLEPGPAAMDCTSTSAHGAYGVGISCGQRRGA